MTASAVALGACLRRRLRRKRGLAPGQRRQRRAGGRAHEAAAADARVDASLFSVQSGQVVLCCGHGTLSKSTGTRASSSPPTAGLRALSADGTARPRRIGNRAPASVPLGRRRRAAERVQETRGRRRRRRSWHGGAGGSGGWAPAAAGDPCSARVEHEEPDRGFSVAPISLRGFSSADAPAEPREAPPGDVVDQARRRSSRARRRRRFRPARSDPSRHAVPALRPASATRAACCSHSAPTNSALRPQRLDTLGRVRAVVLRRPATASSRFDDVDVERAGARVSARDGLVVEAQAVRAAARRASAARRATASASASRRSRAPAPAASSPASARRGDLIADRPAERAGQVARGRAPFAGVDAGRRRIATVVVRRRPRAAAAPPRGGYDAPLAGDRRRSRRRTARRSVAAPRVPQRRSRAPAASADRDTAGIWYARDVTIVVNQVLEVVAVLDEIAREPIEQRRDSTARRPSRRGSRRCRGRGAAARCD